MKITPEHDAALRALPGMDKVIQVWANAFRRHYIKMNLEAIAKATGRHPTDEELEIEVDDFLAMADDFTTAMEDIDGPED